MNPAKNQTQSMPDQPNQNRPASAEAPAGQVGDNAGAEKAQEAKKDEPVEGQYEEVKK